MPFPAVTAENRAPVVREGDRAKTRGLEPGPTTDKDGRPLPCTTRGQPTVASREIAHGRRWFRLITAMNLCPFGVRSVRGSRWVGGSDVTRTRDLRRDGRDQTVSAGFA